jgi:heme-degrading monooxygenase HmoA
MSNWEIAEFVVTVGAEDEFEKRVRDALPIFEAADGFLTLTLDRAVDKESTFLLLIEWTSVAHHTEIFTTTEGFDTFVASVSPLYAIEPRVYHTSRVIG